MSKKQVTIIDESQDAAVKFTRGGRSTSLIGSQSISKIAVQLPYKKGGAQGYQSRDNLM